MTTVLVTGAGGYLGGRLVTALHDSDIGIRAGARHRVAWLPPSVPQVAIDLAAPPDAIAASGTLDGVDAVVHLAGANEVEASADPDGSLADTVAATRHLAAAASLAGVRRFVYVSTVHVYGAAMVEGAVLDEDTLPAPRHAYGLARLASEHVAAQAQGPSGPMSGKQGPSGPMSGKQGPSGPLSGKNSLDLVVMRLTNSVGAPPDPAVDRWSLVANDLCRQAVTDGQLTLKTHGLQWRDFIAVADVCRIIAAVVDPDGPVPAGTYNLGSGQPMTVRALAGLVADAVEAATGSRPPLVAPDPPARAPEPYRVDVARLAAYGLGAILSVADAVAETAAFCLENRGRL